MVQIDVPVAFGVGAFLADAARHQLRQGGPEYYYRALAKNNLFQIFFFNWIPVYFIANYFGWETTYMWWTQESVSAYPYFLPVFLVVFFLAANAGFFLGNRLVKSCRTMLNRGIYIAILLFSAVWSFGQTDRTLRVGTLSEWKQGQAVWFYQDHTFLFMLIFTLVVWAVALLFFYRNLRKEGQQFAP